jgi:hypothetical protein
MKFKVGDNVEVVTLVNGDYPADLGRRGVILEAGEHGYDVGMDGGYTAYFYPEQLKAIEDTPKFKKGDRVRTVCDSFDLPAGSIGTVYGYLGGNDFDVAFDDNTDGHCGLAEDDSTNHRYLDEGQLELLKEDTMTDNISNNPFVIKETIITRRIDYSHVFKDERGVVVAGPAYPGIMLFPNDLRGKCYISSSEVVELRDYLTAYIEAKEITDTK